MAATITEIDGIKIGEEIFTFTSSSGASVRTTKKTIAASDWKTSTASADVSRGKYYYSIYLDGLIGTIY